MNTEFFTKARQRAAEIAERSQNTPKGHYLAFYKSENGYTVGHLQSGWDTRTDSIAFGADPLTESKVLEMIATTEQEATQAHELQMRLIDGK